MLDGVMPASAETVEHVDRDPPSVEALVRVASNEIEVLAITQVERRLS